MYVSDAKIAATWDVYSINKSSLYDLELLFDPCKQIYSDSFFGMAKVFVYIIKYLIYRYPVSLLYLYINTKLNYRQNGTTKYCTHKL